MGFLERVSSLEKRASMEIEKNKHGDWREHSLYPIVDMNCWISGARTGSVVPALKCCTPFQSLFVIHLQCAPEHARMFDLSSKSHFPSHFPSIAPLSCMLKPSLLLEMLNYFLCWPNASYPLSTSLHPPLPPYNLFSCCLPISAYTWFMLY